MDVYIKELTRERALLTTYGAEMDNFEVEDNVELERKKGDWIVTSKKTYIDSHKKLKKEGINVWEEERYPTIIRSIRYTLKRNKNG